MLQVAGLQSDVPFFDASRVPFSELVFRSRNTECGKDDQGTDPLIQV